MYSPLEVNVRVSCWANISTFPFVAAPTESSVAPTNGSPSARVSFWRRLTINHLKVISTKKFHNSQDDLGKEYFTFTYFNDSIIKEACKLIENNKVDLKTNNLVYPNFMNVTNTSLNTTVENEFGVKISTIEHLMGALFGLGIDNAFEKY